MGDENEREEEFALPPAIAAAWGLRERPGKGPKRALSLERIVEAAVKVAAADGLQALSMSRVAAELGASAMALYRYVSSKEELLTHMLDAVFGPPPPLPEPGDDWRTALTRWARALRRVMRRHPEFVRIPISGPPLTPNSVRWMEAGLRCLRGSGLSADAKLSALLLLNGFVRSEVMLMADLAAASAAAGGVDPAETSRVYGRTLAKLTDPRLFPELHEIIRAGVFEDDDDPDYDFEFGLTRILDGLETLIRSSAEEDRSG
ncbi:TetR/AcrR family transcriptional regulator [Thermostaphylospora chromogena]|uniref:Regulatory protein, tetR family n=1 Tax=Thermostaphylospora chromogena TaxID=35622 RepID=A0A1H1EW69_9ACTN|nr:TetR/AcrR family transcriptional regulator [Thermostaphylospora chromogena]SDQ92858.1 regulatory protein, tetR family [Thermostaphylospora chromogena]